MGKQLLEKIVDLQSTSGLYSYTSRSEYFLKIHYGDGFRGTIVAYSKNGNSNFLANHIANNIAYDYLNRPVDRYIQHGDQGDSYQFFFPAGMIYNIEIYEKKKKSHQFRFWIPFPWIQIR